MAWKYVVPLCNVAADSGVTGVTFQCAGHLRQLSVYTTSLLTQVPLCNAAADSCLVVLGGQAIYCNYTDVTADSGVTSCVLGSQAIYRVRLVISADRVRVSLCRFRGLRVFPKLCTRPPSPIRKAPHLPV